MQPYPGMGQFDDEFRAQWDKLVPPSGNADTVQGQLILCAGRLSSEWRRNGNMNVQDSPSFFQAFCDTLEHYICAEGSPIEHALQDRVRTALQSVMENGRDSSFEVDEQDYDAITDAAVLWCRANREPVPYVGG